MWILRWTGSSERVRPDPPAVDNPSPSSSHRVAHMGESPAPKPWALGLKLSEFSAAPRPEGRSAHVAPLCAHGLHGGRLVLCGWSLDLEQVVHLTIKLDRWHRRNAGTLGPGTGFSRDLVTSPGEWRPALLWAAVLGTSRRHLDRQMGQGHRQAVNAQTTIQTCKQPHRSSGKHQQT